MITPALIILIIPVYLLIRGNFTRKPKESGARPAYKSVPLSDTTLRSRSVYGLHDSIQSVFTDTLSGQPRKDLFYLIGGSFTSQKKANEFFKEISDKGYHPHHLGQVGNYFRVALDAFSVKSEADSAVHRLRDTSNIRDAWIYHPGN